MTDSSSLAAVIQEAERLLQDITPGEWTVAPCSDTDETRDVVCDYTEQQKDGRTVKVANWIAELSGDFDFETDVEAEFQKLEAHAKFIAAAPRLLRSLLAVLRAPTTPEHLTSQAWHAGYFSALAKVLQRVSGSDLCPTTAEAVWDQIEIYTAVLRAGDADPRSALSQPQDDVERLTSAILWALGENGEFSEEPEPLAGKYRRRFWWRSELRARAFGAALAVPVAQTPEEP